jgi:hypothetical protein
MCGRARRVHNTPLLLVQRDATQPQNKQFSAPIR